VNGDAQASAYEPNTPTQTQSAMPVASVNACALARSAGQEPKVPPARWSPWGALGQEAALADATGTGSRNHSKRVGVNRIMVTHDQEEAMNHGSVLHHAQGLGSLRSVRPMDIYEGPATARGRTSSAV